MATLRNIDINRVPKKRPTQPEVLSLDMHKKRKRNLGVSPAMRQKAPRVSPKKVREVSYRQHSGFFEVQAFAWRSVASADIFQMSFIRNLFSLRVLFFATLPIMVYQLRYTLVLRPDELLGHIRSMLAVESTTNILVLGLVIVTAALISWLADTLITPSIIRFQFSQLDNRNTTMGQSVREASSEVLHVIGQKIVRVFIFSAIFLVGLVASRAVYILGYGSLNQQIGLLTIMAGLFGIIAVFYFALRFWLQVITAVGGTAERSRIGLGFRQLFYHPLMSFGYGIFWIASLFIAILVSFALILLVIYGLDNTSSVALHIFILAGSATLLCIIWSIWTTWQSGYWTKMIHSRSRAIPLVLSQLDELKYWHFLVLIILVLAVMVLYIVLAFIFSEQIYALLRSFEATLPDTFKLNLPKPQ